MDLGFFKKSIPTLRFLVVFSIVGITVFYQLMSQEERLKIYNPIDINPRLVDISVKNLKKNHSISDFELNQSKRRKNHEQYHLRRENLSRRLLLYALSNNMHIDGL